jgi:hypothetical protein
LNESFPVDYAIFSINAERVRGRSLKLVEGLCVLAACRNKTVSSWDGGATCCGIPINCERANSQSNFEGRSERDCSREIGCSADCICQPSKAEDYGRFVLTA